MSAVTGAAIQSLALWRALRPSQWTKNLFVLAPVFFGGRLTDGESLLRAGLALAAFCAAASCVYLINDLYDRRRDAAHPAKRLRPVASGALAPQRAAIAAAVLGAGALALAAAVNAGTAAVLSAYILLNLAYSRVLKHVVILDVFCVATGFVLRVIAGTVATGVPASVWIVLMTFLLALFLALGKRRQELSEVPAHAGEQRPVLESYSVHLTDELISVVTPVIVVAYLLYTLDPATAERFGTRSLYLTVFPVIFGIFRYLFLVHIRARGESPTEVALSDWPLIGAVLVWLGGFFAVIYLEL